MHRNSVRDMTSGSIVKQLMAFAFPLMLGNVFQMLYNTVDSIVVGNYVSTQALAAIGSTTMIVNMLVFFFNGFSTGAGVVIARFFGAHDQENLHRSVETTMTAAFFLCILFTVLGYTMVKPMLRFMSTPDDVFDDATTYLQIYFLGFSGLLMYNIGSGILRAVGDTIRPLFFLILTSLLNIVLDLTFVLVFRMGIEGVAYATVTAQFVSAILTLLLLTRSNEIYRFVWRDMRLDGDILRSIFMVGLPAGIQSVITAFSNVFVQSYINFFGSSVMAGWSCFNKLDQFVMLPIQSMAIASTTFVSQNIGAGKRKRADHGTFVSIAMTITVTASICTILFSFARPFIAFFTQDVSVIEYGATFLRVNIYFTLFNCVNHVLAGALRGRGDSVGPMVIMLSTFVLLRQIYLFIMTHFIMNEAWVVAFGYPVGWMLCFVIELPYFYFKWYRKNRSTANTNVNHS